MNRIIRQGLCGMIFLFSGGALAQESINVELVGHLPFSTPTADIWGYVDSTGHEYAIMGLIDRTVIIDVSTDPSQPTEVGSIPWLSAPPFGWKDIRTYGNYAYVVREPGDTTNLGMQIIDISEPTNPFVAGYYDSTFLSGHNLHIADGYAYVAGSFPNLGIQILDLSDPIAPEEVGSWQQAYVHDVYVRNDTAYASAIFDGALYIIDVTDKSAPVTLASITDYPFNFTHNAWTTEDGQFVLTTDEVVNGHLNVWDIRDLGNIEHAGEYFPLSGTIIHNVLVKGIYAFISYYTLGFRVVDISDPSNPNEIAYYDTYPQSDDGDFLGAWGVYPFSPSGYIYVSDINSGFYLFRFTDVLEEVIVSPIYVNPGTDSVLVNVSVTETAGLSILAVIALADGSPIDTFPLFDDGLHDDGGAGDSLYGSNWIVPPVEERLHFVDLLITVVDTDTVNFHFKNLARFTTIGPVAFDSYDIIFSDGSVLFFDLNLINNGITATATNISAEISTSDSCVTNINSHLFSFGDIAAGATGTSTGRYSFFINQNCVGDELLTFDVDVSSDGTAFWSDNFEIQLEPVGVNDEITGLPSEYSLSQAYPNPFNPTTTIEFSLPQAGDVSLIVYNLLGQEVAKLVNVKLEAGYHEVTWDASNMASGVYIYRLEVVGRRSASPTFTLTRKMVLLK